MTIVTAIAPLPPWKKLGLIVLLNLLLSIPSLWVPYYNLDELTNAVFARFLLGGAMTLEDFVGNTHLATHYLYALIFLVVRDDSLLGVHLVHALWKSLTILALYDAGKQLHNEKTGLWSAVFYAVYSFCFLSKDFHTPSSESWALLPATLAAGFIFRAVATESGKYYFLAGVLAGLATLFKSPMGISILAIDLFLVFHWSNLVKNMLTVNAAFFLCLAVPIAMVMPPGSGLEIALERVFGSTSNYITFYESSLFYSGIKLLVRTLLVGFSMAAMSVFVCHGFRNLFLVREGRELYWQKLLFLIIWLIFLWLTVVLGKRVFFHYFTFLMAPMPLLAATSLVAFDERIGISRAQLETRIFKFIHALRSRIGILMAIPLLGFSIEGAFNYSTRAVIPIEFMNTAHYIKTHTQTSDRIYVWGYIPQLYFYADRLPATTYIWSDILAGSSPGSSAMEYLQATGRTLSLNEQLLKDFEPTPFKPKKHEPLTFESSLSTVGESELFTGRELLNRIGNSRWERVFADFFMHPPELIIDSSPLNYRGFGYYPIAKYELLKRFVLDNYHLETVIDNMILYRLNSDRKNRD